MDAFVDVRQRQQIQQSIEWGQDPGPESIADEIAPQRRKVQYLIAADVIGTANDVEDCNLWEKIREGAEHAEREQHPSDKIFTSSSYAFSTFKRLDDCCIHAASPCARSAPQQL